MNAHVVTHRCLTAVMLASSLGASVGCVAAGSGSAQWIADTRPSGKTPDLISLSVPSAGGENMANGHAARNIAPMQVALNIDISQDLSLDVPGILGLQFQPHLSLGGFE